jgi:hypothetical protein
MQLCLLEMGRSPIGRRLFLIRNSCNNYSQAPALTSATPQQKQTQESATIPETVQ